MNKQVQMDAWFRLLAELNAERGGYVSAGELAKKTKTARNTAKRWLEKLTASKRAVWTYVASRSGSMAVVYHASEGYEEC